MLSPALCHYEKKADDNIRQFELRQTITKRESERIFWEVAWPVTLEMMLVSLISSVDIMMLKQLGKTATAAAGLCNQPQKILLILIQGINVGTMALVGRCKGAGDRGNANRYLQVSTVICLAISVLLAGLAWPFCEQIMWFCGAQEDTIASGVLYFRMVLVGNIFNAVALSITAAQRGAGNTKISLRVNLTANLVNILFNYYLIGGRCGFPKMGVFGAGIASAIGFFAAMLFAVISVIPPKGYLRLFAKAEGLGHAELRRNIFHIGSGVMLERTCIRVGMLAFIKMVATLGTASFAVYTICQRIINLSFSMGDGFSVAATSLISQSIGAKNRENVSLFSKAGIRYTRGAYVLILLICVLGNRGIVRLFSDDPDVVPLACIGVIVIGIISVVHISRTIRSGILRGAGDTHYIAKIALFNTMLLRPAVAAILCYVCHLGLYGIWASMLLDYSVMYYFTSKRVKKSEWLDRFFAQEDAVKRQ